MSHEGQTKRKKLELKIEKETRNSFEKTEIKHEFADKLGMF